MKLRIGFTIEAEALFGLMAKMLPLDDLNVEELPPERQREPAIRASKIAQLAAARKAPPRGKKPRVRSHGLNQGANRVLMELLADGQPHRAAEAKPLMRAAGFADNSIGSRLGALREKGHIFQPQYGLWQIVRKDREA